MNGLKCLCLSWTAIHWGLAPFPWDFQINEEVLWILLSGKEASERTWKIELHRIASYYCCAFYFTGSCCSSFQIKPFWWVWPKREEKKLPDQVEFILGSGNSNSWTSALKCVIKAYIYYQTVCKLRDLMGNELCQEVMKFAH